MITEIECTFCKEIVKLLKPYKIATLHQEVGHSECAQAAIQKVRESNIKLGYNARGTKKVG